MTTYNEIQTAASDIHKQSIYGELYRRWPAKELLEVAIYKIKRAMYITNIDKKMDDILDAINFLIFAGILIDEQKD